MDTNTIADDVEDEDEVFDEHDLFNPSIVATEFLERLGYRLRDVGLVNESISVKIFAVEHIENGSAADFSFASNMQGTAGIVCPFPIGHYLAWIEEEEED